MICVCRFCSKEYDRAKSRGDWRGFCSRKCEKAMLRRIHWTPKHGSEYDALKRSGEIGDVPVAQTKVENRLLRKMVKTLKLFYVTLNKDDKNMKVVEFLKGTPDLRIRFVRQGTEGWRDIEPEHADYIRLEIDR